MPLDGLSQHLEALPWRPDEVIVRDRRERMLRKMDRAIALIGHRGLWCKRTQKDVRGRRCILGALYDADAWFELHQPVETAIYQFTGLPLQIPAFNDHWLTRHRTVMRVLRVARANIAAGREGFSDVEPGWAARLNPFNRLRTVTS